MTRPLAVFRADASEEIGGGHVMRCLALAQAMVAAGWTCAFACRPATPGAVPALARSGHDCLLLDCEPTNEPAALASRWPEGVDAMIVDHYRLGAEFESACRGWASYILVVDDLVGREHDCDALLNQNPGPEAAAAWPSDGTASDLLVGQSYILLRTEFARWRQGPRATPEIVGRVLVTFGMSDTDNATGQVLRAIDRLSEPSADFDFILGPANSNCDPIRRAIDDLDANVALHVDPPDIAALMANADLAVTAAGSTCWELAFLGVPMVTLTMSRDQTSVARTLAEAGASLDLGAFDTASGGRVVKALCHLMGDVCAREGMSRAGRALVDGRGAERVANRLTARCAVGARVAANAEGTRAT